MSLAAGGLDVEQRRALALARLSAVAARLRAARADEQAILDERLDLFRQLRDLEPPTTYARIADAAGGISEDAVAKALDPRRTREG